MFMQLQRPDGAVQCWFRQAVCCAGSNCPSILPMAQQRELCQISVAAVKCMGFTVGVFHVECKYTSANGPQLIEVSLHMLACRLQTACSGETQVLRSLRPQSSPLACGFVQSGLSSL